MNNKKREQIIKQAFEQDSNAANSPMTKEKADQIAHKIFLSLVDNLEIDKLNEIDKL